MLFQVLSTASDPLLGGRDFDYVLRDHFNSEFHVSISTWHSIPTLLFGGCSFYTIHNCDLLASYIIALHAVEAESTQGLYGFWKAMEIDNAIFQLQDGYGKFLGFV